jgi:hypothetical protein
VRDKEKQRDTERKWRAKNNERLKQRRRELYAASSERRMRIAAENADYRRRNRDAKLAYDRNRYETRRPDVMLWHARRRAAKLKIPCTIAKSDIVIPNLCPYLGVPFAKRGDYVPTLDRIQPHLGYTPENTLVVTKRANRIKNDATWQELLLIGNALQKLLNCE